jgi:hypothetical protein
MYKEVKHPMTGLVTMILRIADNTFIPIDPANGDYQEYLAWLAQGNTPLPAN